MRLLSSIYFVLFVKQYMDVCMYAGASTTTMTRISHLKATYDHVINRRYANDSKVWDIRNNVPGEPGVDYPLYDSPPETRFTCASRNDGYYADVETRCQVFRVCANTDLTGNGFAFLCPNGTLFNQKFFVCDWWKNVNCTQSNRYYGKNSEMGHHLGSLGDMMEAVQQMVDFTKDSGNPYQLLLRKPTFDQHNKTRNMLSPSSNNQFTNLRMHRPSQNKNIGNTTNGDFDTIAIINNMPRIKQYVNPIGALATPSKSQELTVLNHKILPPRPSEHSPRIQSSRNENIAVNSSKQQEKVVMLVNSLGETLSAPLSAISKIPYQMPNTAEQNIGSMHPSVTTRNQLNTNRAVAKHHRPSMHTVNDDMRSGFMQSTSVNLPHNQRKQLISMLGEHIPLQPVSSVYTNRIKTTSNIQGKELSESTNIGMFSIEKDKNVINKNTSKHQLLTRPVIVTDQRLEKHNLDDGLKFNTPIKVLPDAKNDNQKPLKSNNRVLSSEINAAINRKDHTLRKDRKILNTSTNKFPPMQISSKRKLSSETTSNRQTESEYVEDAEKTGKVSHLNIKLNTNIQNFAEHLFTDSYDERSSHKNHEKSPLIYSEHRINNSQNSAELIYSEVGNLMSRPSPLFMTQSVKDQPSNDRRENQKVNGVDSQSTIQIVFLGEGNLTIHNETTNQVMFSNKIIDSGKVNNKRPQLGLKSDVFLSNENQNNVNLRQNIQFNSGNLDDINTINVQMLKEDTHVLSKDNVYGEGNLLDTNSRTMNTINTPEAVQTKPKIISGGTVYSGEGILLSHTSRSTNNQPTPDIQERTIPETQVRLGEIVYSGEANLLGNISRSKNNKETAVQPKSPGISDETEKFSGERNLIDHISRTMNHISNVRRIAISKPSILTGETVYSGEGNLLSHTSSSTSNHTTSDLQQLTIQESQVQMEETVFSGEGDLLSHRSTSKNNNTIPEIQQVILPGSQDQLRESIFSGEGNLFSPLFRSMNKRPDIKKIITKSQEMSRKTAVYSGEHNLFDHISSTVVNTPNVQRIAMPEPPVFSGETVYSGEGNLLSHTSSTTNNHSRPDTPETIPESQVRLKGTVYSGRGNLLSQTSRSKKNHTRPNIQPDTLLEFPVQLGETVYSGEGDLLSQILRSMNKRPNIPNVISKSQEMSKETGVYSGEGNMLDHISSTMKHITNVQSMAMSEPLVLSGEILYSGEGNLLSHTSGSTKNHSRPDIRQETIPESQVRLGETVYSGRGDLLSQTLRSNKNHTRPNIQPDTLLEFPVQLGETVYSGEGDLLNQLLRTNIKRPYIPDVISKSQEMSVKTEVFSRDGDHIDHISSTMKPTTNPQSMVVTEPTVLSGEIVYSGDGNLLSHVSRKKIENSSSAIQNHSISNSQQLVQGTVYSGEGNLLSHISRTRKNRPDLHAVAVSEYQELPDETYSGEGQHSNFATIDHNKHSIPESNGKAEEEVFSGDSNLLSHISTQYLNRPNISKSQTSTEDSMYSPKNKQLYPLPEVQSVEKIPKSHITTGGRNSLNTENKINPYSLDTLVGLNKASLVFGTQAQDTKKANANSNFPAIGYLPTQNLLDSINNLQTVSNDVDLPSEVTNVSHANNDLLLYKENPKRVPSNEPSIRIFESVSNSSIFDINHFIYN